MLALVCAATLAFAADYPTRPVTLVVGFHAGRAERRARRASSRKKMQDILGQPFVIDNRPGAGGNIAGETVAHAAPDGYTLLMGNNSILATNASLYKKIAFDPEKDFLPISLIGTQANILVVNPKVPAHSMAELIALAKAEPGKLNFASSGYGAAAHLAGELFKTQAGIDIVHVAYKGAAPALQDVIAGPGADDVRDRGLRRRPHQDRAGAAARRDDAQAHRDPAGHRRPSTNSASRASTPRPGMVSSRRPGRRRRSSQRCTAPPSRRLTIRRCSSSLQQLGVDIVGDTPEEFAAYIKAEIPKWAAVIKASGAKLD